MISAFVGPIHTAWYGGDPISQFNMTIPVYICQGSDGAVFKNWDGIEQFTWDTTAMPQDVYQIVFNRLQEICQQQEMEIPQKKDVFGYLPMNYLQILPDQVPV